LEMGRNQPLLTVRLRWKKKVVMSVAVWSRAVLGTNPKRELTIRVFQVTRRVIMNPIRNGVAPVTDSSVSMKKEINN